MSNKKRAWIIAVVVFLFAGPAAAYYSFREDPQISAFRAARAMARQDGLSDEEKAKYRQQAAAAWDQMGPEKQLSYQMDRMDKDRAKEWSEREKQRMDEFFALDSKERKKKLQDEIRQDEKNAKEFEARRAKEQAEREKNAALAQNGAGGGTIGGAGQNGQNGQNGQGGRGGGGPGGRGGFGRGGSPQQQRLALDYRSSESRARSAERSREKQDARVQMGLPPQTPRGAWGGGRGGGGGGGGKGGR
jgi:hypothetical protein